ncbi:MAG: tetratricopeptide repeat protein, partial [Myxococcota bacterium]|nr:tetratricopeptide repeat protein [Myxococcota bacterium]
VYKEGWCHINEGSWELALRRFKKVIDLTASQEGVLEEAARQGLRVEALRDYVRAFSNIDPQFSVKRLGRPEDAWNNFSAVGGQDEVLRMVEALGTLYRSRDAHSKAVKTYRLLARKRPDSHRLAVWQAWVLLATSRSASRKVILKEVDTLEKLLEASRARDRQNPLVDRERKKARVDAERSSEEVLRKLAVTQHREARRLRGKARTRAYRFASTLYDAYLRLFPNKPREVEVDYGFYVRFYRGELLVQLDRPLEAADSFMEALDRAPKKPTPQELKLIKVSAEEGVRAYDRVLRTMASDKDAKSVGVARKFLTATERYLDLIHGPLDRFSLDILYRTGRIHYEAGDLVAAKAAFQTVVTKGAGNAVACFAANLVLDIYNGAGDFESLESEARRFSSMKSLGCKPDELQGFRRLAEQAAFKRVREKVGGESGELAEAYLEFHRRYGKSELADDALYNAALEVEKQGDDAQAKALRQELIDTYPTSELTREALFDEAKSAELRAEFREAAERLELFVKRFADDERAPAALSDATAYRDALGDARLAIRNRQGFVSRYSDDEQAHWVYAELCDGMRKTYEARIGGDSPTTRSEWWKLDACYHGYLKNKALASRDVDLTCLMRHRRAQVLGQRLGATKAAAGQREKMMSLWDSLALEEVGKRRRCSTARAEMLFGAAEPAWARYKSMVLSEIDPTSPRAIKLFRGSVAAVTKAREEINARYEEIVQLGAQTWSLAALYRIGESYFATVDKLLTAPVSAALAASPEDVALVREQLRKDAMPLIEVGAKMLEDCRRVSHETGVYNTWVARALETLRYRLPTRHAVRRELLPMAPHLLPDPEDAVLWVPGEHGKLMPIPESTRQPVVKAASGKEEGS